MPVCQEISDLPFLLREQVKAMCSISKKQVVITQVPLWKQAMSLQCQGFVWERCPCFTESLKSLFPQLKPKNDKMVQQTCYFRSQQSEWD